jgi:hypothetical protein
LAAVNSWSITMLAPGMAGHSTNSNNPHHGAIASKPATR